MRYVARVGSHTMNLNLSEDGHTRSVTLDEREMHITWQPVSAAQALPHDTSARAGHYSALVGEECYDLYIRPLPNQDEDDGGGTRLFEVMVGGRPYVVSLQDERAQALATLTGAGHVTGDISIKAPMPGLVSNVMASEGDKVARGQTIVVLEAMKMENDLGTPRAGIVRSVRVAKGQTVNQGEVLAVVGDDPDQESGETASADSAI